MSSSLFQRFGQRQQAQQQGLDQLVAQVQQFRNTFNGDPAAQLQQMINSGQVPQNVLNRAQEMAKPIYNAMQALSGR